MNCRVCSGALEVILKLPNMPARAQYLPDEQALSSDRGVMLEVAQCARCELVQLTNAPVHYWRESIRADVSQEMRDFRHRQLEDFKQFWHVRTVVELGRTLFATTKEYDAFLLTDALEHVPNPNELLSCARKTIPEGGLGIVEVPNFDMILKRNMVAEFMLDHLMYFTSATLTRTLALNGLDVVDIRPVWNNYVLSAVVKKRRRLDLSGMVMEKNPILEFIEGKESAIWGAGHQALATMSLLGLDESKIKYVVDSTPAKQGRYTPVTHIPIVPPQALLEHPVEVLVVMCGSYSEEVLKLARGFNVPNVMVA